MKGTPCGIIVTVPLPLRPDFIRDYEDRKKESSSGTDNPTEPVGNVRQCKHPKQHHGNFEMAAAWGHTQHSFQAFRVIKQKTEFLERYMADSSYMGIRILEGIKGART